MCFYVLESFRWFEQSENEDTNDNEKQDNVLVVNILFDDGMENKFPHVD